MLSPDWLLQSEVHMEMALTSHMFSIAGLHGWRVMGRTRILLTFTKMLALLHTAWGRTKEKQTRSAQYETLATLKQGESYMYSNISKWDGNVILTSVFCTYCKNRVRVFLCTKHIVKLKFNSHFLVNESQGIHVRRPLIQGTFSAQSIREWEMEGEFGIDSLYVQFQWVFTEESIQTWGWKSQ